MHAPVNCYVIITGNLVIIAIYSRGQKCRTTLSNSDENTITLIHSLIKKDIGLIKKNWHVTVN